MTSKMCEIPGSIVQALYPFSTSFAFSRQFFIIDKLENERAPALYISDFDTSTDMEQVFYINLNFFSEEDTKRRQLFTMVRSIIDSNENDIETASTLLEMLSRNELVAQAQKEKDNAN